MARPRRPFDALADSPIPAIVYSPHHELSESVEVCELKSVYEQAQDFGHDPYSPHRAQFHHFVYVAEGTSPTSSRANRLPVRTAHGSSLSTGVE